MKKVAIFLCVIFALSIAATHVFSQYDPTEGIQGNVWLLNGDRRIHLGEDYFDSQHNIVAVLITPDDVRSDIVQAAWTYAIINSEDEFGVQNYEIATEIMIERHPSWIAAVTDGYTINYRFETARDDIAEPETSPEPEITPEN